MARRQKIRQNNRTRLVMVFLLFCGLLLLLCVRTGYVQIVKGDEYAKKALVQQTKDEVVEAKRGAIEDCNGQKLAFSTIKYSVWVRPSLIANTDDKAKNEEKLHNTSAVLAKELGKSEDEIYKELTSNKSLVKIAKYQSIDVAEKLRSQELDGVTLTQETKRYYPLGNFASQLLGSVTDDNNGLAGLEQYYNQKLRGTPGRSRKNTDASGNSLTYGKDTSKQAKDGYTLELTIDEVIQNYAESEIKKTKKATGAKRVSCLMMNPKTGEVLAMASTPGYNPNDSRKPNTISSEEFKQMTEKKQMEYLNSMWRNPLVCDTYEPGSTFKLLTTAMALEEGKVDETETFSCGGGLNVNGTFIKCWINPGSHGTENLKQAVGNSCNPVFMHLAQRLGKDRFYDYLDLFGVSSKTGIDYPGEATAQIQNKKSVGKIELSTMGFGQGIAVTPIQLLTTISAFGNEGYMMQPHLVKAVKNSKGKVVEKTENKVLRQVVSKKTASKILEFMEYVVDKGGGTKAQIKGVRVGGKTGTAQKRSGTSKSYDKLIASFAGIAPVDDPEISILYIVDEPEGAVWGSDVAAPYARNIMKKTLRYLKTKEEQ